MNASNLQEVFDLSEPQHQQLAQFIFEHSSEAIMITDNNNHIVAVNPTLERLTGYRRRELIHRDPIMFSSGKQDAHFYRHMWKDLISKGHWQGEVYQRRKSGEIYPIELSLNVVKNALGLVCNYVGIFHDISAHKAVEQKLAFYASNEPLTGLANRASFIKNVEHHIFIAKRQHTPFCLLFIDIDHFKEINEIYGHGVGDELLRSAAARIVKNVRSEDVVCRYGSDEFTVLLVNTTIENAARVSEKIQKQIRKTFQFTDVALDITTSIGIVEYPSGGRSATALLRNVQHAMVEAIKQGRNSIAFYDKHQQAVYLRKLALRNRLKQAIGASALEVYYQPIVDENTQKANKFEALVRWPDGQGGFIPPDEFIPLAEEFNMIHQIGNFVLLRACKDLKTLHNMGYTNVRFSINRSISEFRYDIDEASIISKTIELFGLPYDALVVEITESVAMSSNSHTELVLDALRANGVKIALDDFCTGYSSLSNLIEYKSDYLKIDKSFVDSVVSDTNHQILVSTLIGLASKLDMTVIAEGVETAEQLDMLKNLGCHFIQGYYYSPAIPLEQCIELLKGAKLKRKPQTPK